VFYNKLLCDKLTTEMTPPFMNSVTNLKITPEYLCGHIFEICPNNFKVLPLDQYRSDRIQENHPKDVINKEYKKMKGKDRRTRKIMQITDVHFDKEYMPGTV
jgi:hypothetical protein